MKTSSVKAKGRRLQHYVRDKILEIFSEHLTKDDVRSTAMGQGGEDIQLSSYGRFWFPFSVECKARKTFSVYSHYDQSLQNAEGSKPLVVIKADRREPLAIMRFTDFMELLRK